MKHICILGSGIGGATLALELIKKTGFKVTLLDCDNIHEKFDINLDLAKDMKNTNKTTGYGFGGTSNLWHGVIARLDSEDFSYINKLCGDDIELKFSTYNSRLRSYFGDVSHLDSRSFSCNSHDLHPFIDFSHFSIKPHIVQRFPTRYRKRIKAALKNHKGELNIIENAVAIKSHLLLGSNVDYIEYIQSDQIKKVYADCFVVSLGALESPRFLHQSFKGSKAHSLKIGCGLKNHPAIPLCQITIPKYIFYRNHGNNNISSNISTRVGFGILNKYRNGSSLNHSLFIRPDLTNNNLKTREYIKKIIYSKPSLKMFFSIILDKYFFYTAISLLSEKFGFGIYTNKFTISMQAEQGVDGGSFVEVSNNKDRYGRFIPKIHHQTDDQIIKDISNITEILNNSIKDSSSINFFDIDNSDLNIGSHYAGTCSIGHNIDNSVVNSNLKYHNAKNLYVCDSSIIPKIGNANLSLTIASFALRLSDHLESLYHK
jgi:hypothetical protein